MIDPEKSTKILLVIDHNLLARVDEEVKRLGAGANRSAFFREATEYYLTIKRGISNTLRKRELNAMGTHHQ